MHAPARKHGACASAGRACMQAGPSGRRVYPAPTPTRHCPIARGQVLSLRTCSNYPSPRALNRPRACAGGPLEPVTDEATGTGSITTAYVVSRDHQRGPIQNPQPQQGLRVCFSATVISDDAPTVTASQKQTNSNSDPMLDIILVSFGMGLQSLKEWL